MKQWSVGMSGVTFSKHIFWRVSEEGVDSRQLSVKYARTHTILKNMGTHTHTHTHKFGRMAAELYRNTHANEHTLLCMTKHSTDKHTHTHTC